MAETIEMRIDEMRKQCACIDLILNRVCGVEIFCLELSSLDAKSRILDEPCSSYAQGSGESYFFEFYAIRDKKAITLGEEFHPGKQTLRTELQRMNVNPDYIVKEDYLDRDIYVNGEMNKVRDVTIKIFKYEKGDETDGKQ
jgi:hypothetical protein